MDDTATDRKHPGSTGNDIVALRATDKDRTCRFRFYSRILSRHEQMLYNTPEMAGMPFENYVWLLWSIKESVYKYRKRICPHLLFSPAGIVVRQITLPSQNAPMSFDLERWESDGQESQSCSGDCFYQGIIHSDAAGDRAHSAKDPVHSPPEPGFSPARRAVLYSRSIIHDGIISSVVSDDKNFGSTWWGVRSIADKSHARQSSMVREFAVNRLKDVLPQAGLQTGKNADLQIGKSHEGYPVVLVGDQIVDIPISLAHHDRFIAYSFTFPG